MSDVIYKGMLYEIENEKLKQKTKELKALVETIRVAADYTWQGNEFDIYNCGLIFKGLKKDVERALSLHEDILSLLEEANNLKIKIGGK